MFATIELQKQAAADRYYHQLHPKPWAKSPEEAAWALMQRIMGLGQWDGSSRGGKGGVGTKIALPEPSLFVFKSRLAKVG